MNEKDCEFFSDLLRCETETAASMLKGKRPIPEGIAAFLAGISGTPITEIAAMRPQALSSLVAKVREGGEARKRQVLGFIFNRDGGFWLARKKNPEWQAGMLNGIGGKVKDRETSRGAMTRFGESAAGLSLDWKEYACISRDTWNCKVYWAISQKTPTGKDEDILGCFEFADLSFMPNCTPLVSGVRLLVLAALDRMRDPKSPYVVLRMLDDPSELSVYGPAEGGEDDRPSAGERA